MSQKQRFDWIVTIKAKDKETVLARVPFTGTDRQCFGFGVELAILNPGTWIGQEKSKEPRKKRRQENHD